jgi:hypothetical protein
VLRNKIHVSAKKRNASCKMIKVSRMIEGSLQN